VASSILFSNAQLIDGSIVDIATDNGLIAWIGPTNNSPVVSIQNVNLNGYILSSAFVEPHAHLDKAYLADRISNPDGDLMGAIKGLEEVRTTITHQDIVDRATRAVKLMSHTDPRRHHPVGRFVVCACSVRGEKELRPFHGYPGSHAFGVASDRSSWQRTSGTCT
jgi:cytosine deaminase